MLSSLDLHDSDRYPVNRHFSSPCCGIRVRLEGCGLHLPIAAWHVVAIMHPLPLELLWVGAIHKTWPCISGKPPASLRLGLHLFISHTLEART